MGLGPKQMQVSIIRNLKEKTGKSLEEWHAVLNRQVERGNKKDRMIYLKETHQLGHIQAKVVAEQYEGIDPYKDTDLFDLMIFNEPTSWALYEWTKAKVLALGEDVEVKPCRTYIPFYRTHQFALCTKSKTGIFLALNLPATTRYKGFLPAKNLGSVRMNAKIELTQLSDWTPELETALLTAYNQN